MCLATITNVHMACAVRVTIFSNCDKFRLVSNFMEFHAVTLAARSCVLLFPCMCDISQRSTPILNVFVDLSMHEQFVNHISMKEKKQA